MALVTGGAGLLGSHLARALPADGFLPHLTTHRTRASVGGCRSVQLDLTDRRAVEEAVAAIAPSVVIHAAAITDVDYCQTHLEEARQVNVCGTRHLARAAAGVGAFLIYVSTDYVFDGLRGGYRETDYPSPRNWYGLTKLAGELAASTCLPGADLAIVRTTFYGPRDDGRGLFSRCLATLTAGQGLDAAADLISSPLPVTVLARALTELAGRRLGGIHHIAGAERSSRYEFALAVARVHGLDASLVRPVSARAFNPPGPRPRDVSLCVCRAQERLRVSLPALLKGLEELSVDGAVIKEGLGDGSR
ncbi:MAG: SDR family oxidoreductase [Bacillota bacterium]